MALLPYALARTALFRLDAEAAHDATLAALARMQGTPLQALWQGALACLVVAALEELVFRGFVFQRLVEGVGAWLAQPLMAAYFVLTHSQGLAGAGALQWLAGANIFIAGLVFGTAYLATRSLALPIALHFGLNFLQGPVLGFGVSGHAGDSAWVPVADAALPAWHGGAFGLEAGPYGSRKLDGMLNVPVGEALARAEAAA